MSYELPLVISDVARLIGLPAAFKLAARFGGTRVYVPKPDKLHAEHVLVGVLGMKLARVLADERSGEWLDLPLCAGPLRRVRDLEIVRRYEGGESSRKLAREFGITERTIYRVAKRPDLSDGDEELTSMPGAHRGPARPHSRAARRRVAEDRQLPLPLFSR